MTILKFLNNVNTNDNGCWKFMGCRRSGKFDYGWMTFRGKQTTAHRVAWTLFNGEIPNGKLVLHKCDVPSCVNPRHLFLGSYSDNMQDMWNKGRHSKPKGAPKLNIRQVFFIKQWLGKISQKQLGEIFGVGQSTIAMISTGRNWRHV